MTFKAKESLKAENSWQTLSMDYFAPEDSFDQVPGFSTSVFNAHIIEIVWVFSIQGSLKRLVDTGQDPKE